MVKKGCSDKEKTYIKKIGEKLGGVAEKLKKEIARLKKMAARKMKPALQSWMAKRKKILEKLLGKTEEL